jgi:hypothetical protein
MFWRVWLSPSSEQSKKCMLEYSQDGNLLKIRFSTGASYNSSILEDKTTLATITMMMTILYKYISGEKRHSYRGSEVLIWCMSFSAIHNNLTLRVLMSFIYMECIF